jgi:hypothetical protein
MSVADRIRAALAEAGIDFEESAPGTFTVTLPGEHKLATTCAIVVGEHAVTFNAFVIRCPEENRERIHQWLLERNARMYGVMFALDGHGDVYLVGRMAHHAVTASEIDRYLGSVLQYADSAFPQLLEMGFASAIRREWAWRVSRGEPLTNLLAFSHLIDGHEEH